MLSASGTGTGSGCCVSSSATLPSAAAATSTPSAVISRPRRTSSWLPSPSRVPNARTAGVRRGSTRNRPRRMPSQARPCESATSALDSVAGSPSATA
ncbi:hypothetical protein NB705_003744 [Xanthomonas sacchari]|nr:hypothetical protein [Xanthomonas sacchari]